MDQAHKDHKVREGSVKVPGGNIWYRIVGAGKKGVPLLTVHGGPGAPHQYLKPLQALANQRPVIFTTNWAAAGRTGLKTEIFGR